MNSKKIFLTLAIVLFTTKTFTANPISTGTFKDWQVFTATTEQGKICFAQSKPKTRSPKNFKRESSKLFVTFRPQENIKDEVSVTSGHAYKTSTVKLSQFLDLPVDLGVLAKELKENNNRKIKINNFFKNINLFLY